MLWQALPYYLLLVVSHNFCVCVKAGDSLGTATLANVEGCVVALTCAHVLGQVFGKEGTFCEKDIATNKFKLASSGSFFGRGFSNDDMDIAGVLRCLLRTFHYW